jgi:hypothetical protein
VLMNIDRRNQQLEPPLVDRGPIVHTAEDGAL